MKRIFLVVGLAALVAGCAESPQEKQARLMAEGIEQLNNYKFEAAQDKFSQLGELDPQSPASYFGSGLILERQLLPYDALHVYMSIANSHPGFAEAHAGEWRILTQLGWYFDALKAAENYQAAAPDDPEAKLLMAEAFMNASVAPRAHAYLDSARLLGEDPAVAGVLQARALAMEHRLEAADSVYRVALTQGRASATVYADAVGYLEALGLVDSAVAMSRQAVKLSGDEIPRMLSHYRLVVKHHYFYEARQLLTKLKALGIPELVSYRMDLEYYLERGLKSNASTAMNRIFSLAPEKISSRILQMDVRGRSSDEMTATTTVDALQGIMMRQDYDEEYTDLMFFITLDMLGEIFPDRSTLARLDDLRPMYKSRPEYQLSSAMMEHYMGKFQEFGARVAAIRRSHSRQPDWVTGLADVYGHEYIFKYDTAAQVYARVLAMDSLYRPAFVHWTEMHARLNQYDSAVQVFEQYPQFVERYADLAPRKAVYMVRAGRPEAGLDLFLSDAPLVKGNISLYEELKEGLEAAWATEQMTRLAQWLSENGGGNADLLDLAAEIHNDLGTFADARVLAEEAAVLDANWLNPSVQVARAVYGLGEPEAAIEILEESLAADRYHIGSNHWLSRILAAEGIEPNRAANLARRALFDSGGALEQWLNLSYVYVLVGRYDLARGEALKASRSYQGEPEPLFRLGVALYMDGEEEEAKAHLEEALEKGLRGPSRTEAQSLLAKL